MRYDTKFALAVSPDLAAWQKLNVVAFLAGGLAGAAPETVGEPYADGSGRAYGPLIRQPILIFAAESAALTAMLQRAGDGAVQVSLYTRDLFSTGHDAANRAAVAAVPTEGLDLVGLGFYGPRKAVDRLTKGLALHP
jgi:hypothetical protein